LEHLDFKWEDPEDHWPGPDAIYEHGAKPLLREVLDRNLLSFTTNTAELGRASNVIIVIAMPIAEFLNSSLNTLCLDQLTYLSDEQMIKPGVGVG
jgi:hypothetical protein